MTDSRAALLDLIHAAQAAGAPVVTVPVELLEGVLTTTVVTPTEDLLTVKQAAARLGVTPGYLYRKAKTLPFTRKLSHKVLRFDPIGLERWKAERKAAA